MSRGLEFFGAASSIVLLGIGLGCTKEGVDYWAKANQDSIAAAVAGTNADHSFIGTFESTNQEAVAYTYFVLGTTGIIGAGVLSSQTAKLVSARKEF